MSLISEITTRLQTAGVGTAGTTLFQNRLPASPDNCVAVRQVGGHRAERTMGPVSNPPVLDRPTLNVLVRHSTTAGADALIAAVLAALDWYSGTIDGVTYKLISLAYGPMLLGEDENRRLMMSVTFDVLKERS